MATPNTPIARLVAAYPQLFVDDVDAACNFFGTKLGFSTVFKHGTPPFYAQVARDGVRMNLRCVVPSPVDRARAQQETLLSAYVMVDNVAALFEDMQRRGAPMYQELKRAAWQMDEFIVKDPSGNLILFASDSRE